MTYANIATLSGPRLNTLVAIAVEADIPVTIWGDPGIGKSAGTVALSKLINRHIEAVIASLYEPTDFVGLPVADLAKGTTRRLPGGWAVRCAEAEQSVLFLDEISQAAPATQAALMRVVLDREVGDFNLGRRCSVVAAANTPDDAAGGWEMSLPLTNRFMHVEAECDRGGFVSRLQTGLWAQPEVTALPSTWRNLIGRYEVLAGGFLTRKPEFVHVKPTEAQRAATLAWPSPRSWTNAITFMAAAASVGHDFSSAVTEAGLFGLIGKDVASEFLNWASAQDLPDPEVILADPANAEIPTRGDRLATTLDAVVGAACREHTSRKARVAAAWTYLGRVATSGSVDVATPAAMTLARACRQIGVTPPASVAAFTEVLRKAGLMA